jgi:alpha-beta hydrolase superfamily lysophospholipase
VEWQAPSLGAGGILHPARRPVSAAPLEHCVETVFAGAGVSLGGWRCTAPASRRGTLVYLHGVADTRASAAGIVKRFTARGFDVIAYDSRAHGSSEGDFCSYGFEEKHDPDI